MNIVVLMKQVPDTESQVDITEGRTGIDEEEIRWTINPYDEFSLEEALLIKENRDDVKVTVLTVGPDRVREAIRVAYAMGVDEAVHINDEMDEEVYGAVDAHTTAKIITKALEGIPYDLIIAGQRAVDDDNYQVPALVASKLGIPMINNVIRQNIEKRMVTCHQVQDGGTAVIQAPLPLIFTTQRGINEPRYPALRAIMKARKREVDERELEDIGLSEEAVGINAAKVKIRKLYYPPERNSGRVIEGASAAAKAKELVRLLKEEARII